LSGVAALTIAAVCLTFSGQARAQAPEWQAEVRKLAGEQNWNAALHIVDAELKQHPDDLDLRAWRARVLTWSGDLAAAEKEYGEILAANGSDPDDWQGLATVLQREGRLDEALAAADRAVQLDPKRADLRISRARISRAKGDAKEARENFQEALKLDPGSREAREGLASLQRDPKHIVRIGEDNDLFNFADANHGEWLAVTSAWTRRWQTTVGTGFFQRAGISAEKIEGSVTARLPLAAITVGGAGAHDEGIIPTNEAYFGIDHGWKLSETGWIRGVEIDYGQHWYWYTTARILTLNEATTVYLPRDWMWSLRLTGARNVFSGTGVDWKPSGMSRLDFPLKSWAKSSLAGSILYAVGTEDFAQVDQIGSFSSQNYGGGLRFRFTQRQEWNAYAVYQKRTQGRTQTSFGFSYAIHF
jgi:tetratricopeptide (TPR) repeat protein